MDAYNKNVCEILHVFCCYSPLPTDVLRTLKDTLLQRETIVSITETWDDKWGGILIKTTKQTLSFMISSHQSCYESFGVDLYAIPPSEEDGQPERVVDDDHHLYDGCTLLSYEYDHKVLPDKKRNAHYYWVAVRLTMVNEKGEQRLLRVEIYNEHNGYYAHDYLIMWDGHKDKDML
jgi:hypothetical protein